jgi:lipoprotein-releasing system ATP-binding protein
MSEPLLATRGLAMSYAVGGRSLPILTGVDLEVLPGEVLAIVGSSGAGKSTLLHLMGLLDRPTAGQVLFRGEDVGSKSRRERALIRRRHVAFVFQFYHLIHELTALDNVVLSAMLRHGPLRWLGRRSAERARAAALLERLGLEDRLEHRPNQLSGGERQRVAIARALIGDPDLVLCDEPTGNLDERTSREIADLLFELRRETQKTFVWVTHDQDLAAKADRVLRLHLGKIERH